MSRNRKAHHHRNPGEITLAGRSEARCRQDSARPPPAHRAVELACARTAQARDSGTSSSPVSARHARERLRMAGSPIMELNTVPGGESA